jgi:transcriptional regulator with XRE-family HTH domain
MKHDTPSNSSKVQGFSIIIHKLLEHHSLSFRKFAKALGVTHPSLVRLSTNPNANPSMRTLKKLSGFFKISIAELLGEQKIDFKNRPKELDFDEN